MRRERDGGIAFTNAIERGLVARGKAKAHIRARARTLTSHVSDASVIVSVTVRREETVSTIEVTNQSRERTTAR
jgi:hypothetical protein